MRKQAPFLVAMGGRIFRLRKALGFSLRELADFADTSHVHLWQAEKGRTELGAWTLLKISNAMGCTADYLLRGGKQ